MKQLYIITYENAQWCGGELYCLVWAMNEWEADMLAGPWMEEQQLELYSDHYDEEPLEEGDCCTSLTSIELLSDSDHYTYALDPNNTSFYPCINSQ